MKMWGRKKYISLGRLDEKWMMHAHFFIYMCRTLFSVARKNSCSGFHNIGSFFSSPLFFHHLFFSSANCRSLNQYVSRKTSTMSTWPMQRLYYKDFKLDVSPHFIKFSHKSFKVPLLNFDVWIIYRRYYYGQT